MSESFVLVERRLAPSTTEAPQRQRSRRGRIPGEPLALLEVGPMTLCSERKPSPYLNYRRQSSIDPRVFPSTSARRARLPPSALRITQFSILRGLARLG